MNKQFNAQVNGKSVVRNGAEKSNAARSGLMRLLRDSRGASAVEYIAILGLVVVAAVAVISGVGTKINEAKSTIDSGVKFK